jgi:hypothetical protein
LREEGFYDLMKYDKKKDGLSYANLRKSEILKRIAEERGMGISQVIKSIKARAEMKRALVKLAREKSQLLDVEYVIRGNNWFLNLVRGCRGLPDYEKLIMDFKDWLLSIS